jgi:hypothetical protein
MAFNSSLRGSFGFQSIYGSGRLGSFSNPVRSATFLVQKNITKSGYYWIQPQNTKYYVYCDLVNQGGGWMLMMNVKANSNIHVLSNSAATSLVDGNATVSITSSTANRWSTDTVNDFLGAPGVHITWIEPARSNVETSLNSSSQWWQRPDDTGIWPNNLDCSNYSSYINSSQTSWLWRGYGSAANAINNTSVATGNYSGANHFAPTVYPIGQTFFSGSGGNGIRFSSPWNAGSPHTDNNNGYLWLKNLS